MQPTGKQDQFLSVIQSNRGIIYKVANAYCNNAEDRKDMVQEIVLQLWRAFDRYNAEYKYSTWVYRIALNVAISFYRKESSRKKISHDLTDAVSILLRQKTRLRKKPICNCCSSLLAD